MGGRHEGLRGNDYWDTRFNAQGCPYLFINWKCRVLSFQRSSEAEANLVWKLVPLIRVAGDTEFNRVALNKVSGCRALP